MADIAGFVGGWKAIAITSRRPKSLRRFGGAVGDDGKGRDRSWKRFRATRYHRA